jgi:hypothetical protein
MEQERDGAMSEKQTTESVTRTCPAPTPVGELRVGDRVRYQMEHGKEREATVAKTTGEGIAGPMAVLDDGMRFSEHSNVYLVRTGRRPAGACAPMEAGEAALRVLFIEAVNVERWNGHTLSEAVEIVRRERSEFADPVFAARNVPFWSRTYADMIAGQPPTRAEAGKLRAEMMRRAKGEEPTPAMPVREARRGAAAAVQASGEAAEQQYRKGVRLAASLALQLVPPTGAVEPAIRTVLADPDVEWEERYGRVPEMIDVQVRLLDLMAEKAARRTAVPDPSAVAETNAAPEQSAAPEALIPDDSPAARLGRDLDELLAAVDRHLDAIAARVTGDVERLQAACEALTGNTVEQHG